MKILFAINSNGLGHATRCIPLINEVLRRKHRVYIISTSRAIDFLRNEYGNKVTFIEQLGYSISKAFTRKKVSINRFILHLPLLAKEFFKERANFKRIDGKYCFDIILSDGNIGIYNRKKPSYFINHHFRIYKEGVMKNPLSIFTELFFYILRRNFAKYIVPDSEKNSLSGYMSHNLKFLKKKDVEYIGILSMMKKLRIRQDIDYFFSISGPEPQRTVFEEIILNKIRGIRNNKIVVTLGKSESYEEKKFGNITIYSYLDKRKQTEIMNRAKLVITRPSYTTMMDLAELGKKALFVPTPGKPENLYLAKHNLEGGQFYFKAQDHLDFPADLEKAIEYPGFKSIYRTTDSIKRFNKLIFNI